MAGAAGSGLLVAVGFAAGIALATAIGWAQAPAAVKRTVLLTKPLAAKGYTAVVARGEVPPGMAAPRHSHPGDERVVLLEGEVEVDFDGAAPVRVRAGEAMHVEAGRVHRPRSVGDAPARFISVWVVEDGKPLTMNAP